MTGEATLTAEYVREEIRQKLKVEFGIKLSERSKIMKLIDEYARIKKEEEKKNDK